MPTGWVPAPLLSARSLCACCCWTRYTQIRALRRFLLSYQPHYGRSFKQPRPYYCWLLSACSIMIWTHTPITHCVIFHWKHSLRHGHQGILWAVIVHTNASGLLFVSLLQCIDIHYVIPGCIYSVSIDIFCLKNVGKQWKKSQYS